ncbi:MAG: sodium ion-translocating decarboxylase subunit beta, partial [Candidatus Cloacimonadales bacterium]|nr:sodium ion-translocating decarboxylase subunit beta [Candidatus Cloacimonadota bacterium]
MEIMLSALAQFQLSQLIMIVVGIVLIWLAISKKYEPALLLPIGFGTILTNIPMSAAIGEHGPLTVLFKAGIDTELFPLLIFI